MPVMTPNSDFNTKFVNVWVMMMLLSFACASRVWMNDATASLFPLSAERFARTTG